MPNLLCYEELLGGPRQRLCVAGVRREHRVVAVLHVGYHRAIPRACCFSHRSTLLHSYAACTADCLGISGADAPAGGADVPCQCVGHAVRGRHGRRQAGVARAGLDGKCVYELLRDEKVTLARGRADGLARAAAAMPRQRTRSVRFSTLRHVVIGGSALPRAMMREIRGEVRRHSSLHAWGMTEMSPLGTVCRSAASTTAARWRSACDVQAKQGRAVFGVDMKIVDDDGNELPQDGKAFGDLMVRGPWIVQRLLQGRGRRSAGHDADGHGSPPATWPPSTPTATCRSPTAARTSSSPAANGSARSTSRTRDGTSRSGEAAVIGVVHPKWEERPLLVVVGKPGAESRARSC